ncbi:DUF397 domain-containing protein [Gandjariella thermophila]|uniref:DUF397 domain-containing protein n=1 Tax=Gandjariella thermophila TaxID=1931992 RepID=A0A4D4JAN1_9PSEU|nr:DUF397 domain-containing protein [Gandjariella thermophila]GDY32070.1 hypothetical protein GTS_37030 [Gandjariella thermophila]
MTHHKAATTSPFTTGGWAAAASCGPNGGNCVQINLDTEGVVGVRDGKRPSGPVLAFTATSWRAFLAAVRAGRLER